MIKTTTIIQNCFTIELDAKKDKRGIFVKTLSKTNYSSIDFPKFDVEEEYYSISKKDVIRGLHFQTPPFDHDKIVFCPKGRILDVIVDLRKGSKSFLKHLEIELSEKTNKLIFIPKGCAHGFYSFEDDSILIYKVSSEYSVENDKGINWKSFKINWPAPFLEYIISERDKNLPFYKDFNNPF